MITIDGSYGEGGGQILRTSASLATITGETVKVQRIRAGRAEPGLKAQHLTAIQAAMRVCNGHLQGGNLGATEVVMTPGSAVQPGSYEFDVGTAGSAPLVFQTVLLPLLLAGAKSHAILVGGTHNTNAPSSDYLVHTFLGALSNPVEATVERVGFFPRGGGRIAAFFRPTSLDPVRLIERGERTLLTALMTISEGLPSHILERAGAEIERRAGSAIWPLRLDLRTVPASSPGMAVHLDAAYTGGRAGFTVLGRKGLATERVVEEAWANLETFESSRATVDERLADQLVLPGLFADGPSEYYTGRMTNHLQTMAWLVERFGLGRVLLDEATGRVRIYPAGSVPERSA